METQTSYFDKAGTGNTDEVLALAKARAEELGIRHLVVASSTGDTGARAARLCPELTVIAVNGLYPEKIDAAHRATIEAAGGTILCTGHAFGMLGRAVRKKLGAVQADEIIAQTLKLFGEGMKVAAEVICMATDASLVAPGEEVMAVGGTGRGADAAMVIRAAQTQDFFDMRILEIVCKPR
ncbi:MAG: hypothetical protein HN380_25025 [Victivallales bacterium]|jgi:uncharacterized protein|nr:hypothetical protein [Victivallales bacterium]